MAMPSFRALARELVDHCKGYRQIMQRPDPKAFQSVPHDQRQDVLRRAREMAARHAALVRVPPEQRQGLVDNAFTRLPQGVLGAQTCIQVLEYES